MTEAVAEVQEVDLDRGIRYVSSKSAGRYKRWVSEEDLIQELHLFVLDKGRRDIDKAVSDGDRSRTLRTLFGHARRYAETEKAAQSGYAFEDIAWYDPTKLATLIPMALDPCWDGLVGESDQVGGHTHTDGREGGNLLAMVIDVRIALGSTMDWAKPSDFDPDTDLGMERLAKLADRLGGEFPNSPGYQRGPRRRAISNATAAVITHGNEQGGE